jgi:ribosomal protein S27E
MANPFALAAALARGTVAVRCPHCGHTKVVARKPAAFRTCPRCKHRFPDPLSPRPPRK